MSQPSIPPQTFPTSDEGFRLIRVSNPDSSLPFRVANGWFLILFQLSGKAEVQSPNHQLNLEGGSVYRGSDPSQVKWGSDSRTEAVAIHLSKAFLASQLEAYRPGLNPDVRASVFENRPDFKIADLTEHDQRWIQSLELPPVVGIASKFWFRAKLQELLALQTFPSGPPKQDFFCSQQRRIQSKRVESVKRILEASLDEPLSLKDLAREIGCSSAYLCRTFSAETGTTISRYLRSRRIEKAAELIQSGRFNVSEAAVEVGYQSLSHFSKAFFEEKGCLPSQFLNAA
tara:strand:+ start:8168 stop:9025 length:858 start_codon:yes stop_codon:yes gene_type:complete